MNMLVAFEKMSIVLVGLAIGVLTIGIIVIIAFAVRRMSLRNSERQQQTQVIPPPASVDPVPYTPLYPNLQPTQQGAIFTPQYIPLYVPNQRI